MNLNARHLKTEIEKILNEDGISPEELANKSGVHRSTIYSILAEDKQTAQRATARKIAEGTGRRFRIDGDKAYFEKQLDVLVDDINAEVKEIIERIQAEPDPERRKLLLEIYHELAKMPQDKIKAVKILLGLD